MILKRPYPINLDLKTQKTMPLFDTVTHHLSKGGQSWSPFFFAQTNENKLGSTWHQKSGVNSTPPHYSTKTRFPPPFRTLLSYNIVTSWKKKSKQQMEGPIPLTSSLLASFGGDFSFNTYYIMKKKEKFSCLCTKRF